VTRRAPISAVVLTYNEERNVGDCLASLSGWVAETFVVDSGSMDRTVEMARNAGAIVRHHPFETHAKQWNWALRTLPFAHDWVLCLDADHRPTPELAAEIVRIFGVADSSDPEISAPESSSVTVDGFYIKRREIFRGRWIKHGAYYPKYLLKLVRHERAWCDENELLDFRFYVKGATSSLAHDLIEDNQNEADISFWVTKHARFAMLQADEERRRAGGDVGWSLRPRLFGTPDQRVLWLKQRWYRMPLYLRPFLYFLYRYVLRLGFLDGKEGFIFHFLQAFWYRLLVDIRLDELRRVERERRLRR
jgi:glycosyltransferase involved in cell wall biosynthesis